MKDPLPFDHRPDLVLGRALREALDPGDDAQVFTARVLARAEHARAASWDAVLARWARAGVAAALVGSRRGSPSGPAAGRSGSATRPRRRPSARADSIG